MNNRPDIKKMFKELNDRHFDGEIPDMPVVWNGRMTTTAGYCRYTRIRAKDGFRMEPTKIDLSEKLFRNLDYDLSKIERTLIHEMVHAYLLHKYDEKGHTARFQRMMRDITGEWKNHRCHNYDVSAIKRKQKKSVKWSCTGCDAEGYRARMPKAGRIYTCRSCRSRVVFSRVEDEQNIKKIF